MLRVVVILLLSLHCANTQSCVEEEVKSNQSICLRLDELPFYAHDSCAEYGYATLYYFLVCKDIHLIRGKPLPVQRHNVHDYQYLIFRGSSLPSVLAGVFTSNVAKVSRLFMNNSDVKEIEPGAFNGMFNLEELHLENNSMVQVTKGVFNSLVQLTVLDISNNSLEKMEDGTFHGLLKLQSLSLQRNRITNITSGTFSSLGNLKRLDLSYNKIANVDEMSLHDLINLDSLVLNNNDLLLLPFRLFETTTNLIVADVSFNEIELLDFKMFDNLTLQTLNASQNKIKGISNWHHLQNAEAVDLKGNEIFEITLIGPNVTDLNLSYNSLVSLNSLTFNKSHGLLSLDCSHNDIENVQSDSLRGLSQLKSLRLNNNKLGYLPIGCFQDLAFLTSLSLSHNFLSNLEFGTFSGLSNVKELFLDHNRLVVVHENWLYVLTSLEKLSLDDNQINIIDATSLTLHLKQLNSISLDKNNWTCNVLLNIVHGFKEKGVAVYSGNIYNTSNVIGISCTHEKPRFAPKSDLSNTVLNRTQQCPNLSEFWNTFDYNFMNSMFYKFFNSTFAESIPKLQENQNELLRRNLDDIFRNSSFYNFFYRDFADSLLVDYFQNAFVKTRFVKYFDEAFENSSRKQKLINDTLNHPTDVWRSFDNSFVNSLFYKFFNDTFAKSVTRCNESNQYNAPKNADEIFAQSDVYNFFSKDFTSTGFVDFFQNGFMKSRFFKYFEEGFQSRKLEPVADYVKDSAQPWTDGNLDKALDKLTTIVTVILILLLIITLLLSSLLFLLWRMHSGRQFKLDVNQELVHLN